jgi:hypothetical protein
VLHVAAGIVWWWNLLSNLLQPGRPDGEDDHLGTQVLDEPSAFSLDPEGLALLVESEEGLEEIEPSEELSNKESDR